MGQPTGHRSNLLATRSLVVFVSVVLLFVFTLSYTSTSTQQLGLPHVARTHQKRDAPMKPKKKSFLPLRRREPALSKRWHKPLEEWSSILEPQAIAQFTYGAPHPVHTYYVINMTSHNPSQPYVQLEHIDDALSSIECENAGSSKTQISLHFDRLDVMRHAYDRWSTYGNGFHVVTLHEGCNDEDDRGAHLVHDLSVDEDNKILVLQTMTTKDIAHSSENKSVFYSGGPSLHHDASLSPALQKRAWDTVDEDNTAAPYMLNLTHVVPAMEPIISYQSLNVYCVDCETHGSFDVTFQFEIDALPPNKITNAYFKAKGTKALYAIADFKLVTDGAISIDTDQLLGSVGTYNYSSNIGASSLPGSADLDINFYVDFQPYAKVTLLADTTLTFGAELNFTEIPSIMLDPFDPNPVQSAGWNSLVYTELPTCFGINNITAELLVTLGPRMNFEINGELLDVSAMLSASIKLALPYFKAAVTLPVHQVDDNCNPSTAGFVNALQIKSSYGAYAEASGSYGVMAENQFIEDEIKDLHLSGEANGTINLIAEHDFPSLCYDLGDGGIWNYFGTPVCLNNLTALNINLDGANASISVSGSSDSSVTSLVPTPATSVQVADYSANTPANSPSTAPSYTPAHPPITPPSAPAYTFQSNGTFGTVPRLSSSSTTSTSTSTKQTPTPNIVTQTVYVGGASSSPSSSRRHRTRTSTSSHAAQYTFSYSGSYDANTQCAGLDPSPAGPPCTLSGMVCTSKSTWKCIDNSASGVVPTNTFCACNAFRPIGWSYVSGQSCSPPMICVEDNMYSLCEYGSFGFHNWLDAGQRCRGGAVILT